MHPLKIPSFKACLTATTQLNSQNRHRCIFSALSAELLDTTLSTDLRAVFTVYLGDSLIGNNKIKHVVLWIDRLPSDLGTEVDAIYQASFTLTLEITSRNRLGYIRGARQGFTPLPLWPVQN